MLAKLFATVENHFRAGNKGRRGLSAEVYHAAVLGRVSDSNEELLFVDRRSASLGRHSLTEGWAVGHGEARR